MPKRLLFLCFHGLCSFLGLPSSSPGLDKTCMALSDPRVSPTIHFVQATIRPFFLNTRPDHALSSPHAPLPLHWPPTPPCELNSSHQESPTSDFSQVRKNGQQSFHSSSELWILWTGNRVSRLRAIYRCPFPVSLSSIDGTGRAPSYQVYSMPPPPPVRFH